MRLACHRTSARPAQVLIAQDKLSRSTLLGEPMSDEAHHQVEQVYEASPDKRDVSMRASLGKALREVLTEYFRGFAEPPSSLRWLSARGDQRVRAIAGCADLPFRALAVPWRCTVHSGPAFDRLRQK